MRRIVVARPLLLLSLLLLSSACSIAPKTPPPLVYDFGPVAAAAATAGPAPAVVQVNASPWLDGTGIVFRLDYRDAAQRAAYRDSRWAAAPAALLAERLRQQAARAAVTESGTLLRVDLEEFCQAFAEAGRSRAVLRLRAALLDASGRVLRRRTLELEHDAATPDAAGGAHALAAAADSAAVQLLAWAAAPR